MLDVNILLTVRRGTSRGLVRTYLCRQSHFTGASLYDKKISAFLRDFGGLGRCQRKIVQCDTISTIDYRWRRIAAGRIQAGLKRIECRHPQWEEESRGHSESRVRRSEVRLDIGEVSKRRRKISRPGDTAGRHHYQACLQLKSLCQWQTQRCAATYNQNVSRSPTCILRELNAVVEYCPNVGLVILRPTSWN